MANGLSPDFCERFFHKDFRLQLSCPVELTPLDACVTLSPCNHWLSQKAAHDILSSKELEPKCPLCCREIRKTSPNPLISTFVRSVLNIQEDYKEAKKMPLIQSICIRTSTFVRKILNIQERSKEAKKIHLIRSIFIKSAYSQLDCTLSNVPSELSIRDLKIAIYLQRKLQLDEYIKKDGLTSYQHVQPRFLSRYGERLINDKQLAECSILSETTLNSVDYATGPCIECDPEMSCKIECIH